MYTNGFLSLEIHFKKNTIKQVFVLPMETKTASKAVTEMIFLQYM